jgi:hypothetical protein
MASGLGALLSILGGAGGAYYDIQTAKEREAIAERERQRRAQIENADLMLKIQAAGGRPVGETQAMSAALQNIVAQKQQPLATTVPTETALGIPLAQADIGRAPVPLPPLASGITDPSALLRQTAGFEDIPSGSAADAIERAARTRDALRTQLQIPGVYGGQPFTIDPTLSSAQLLADRAEKRAMQVEEERSRRSLERERLQAASDLAVAQARVTQQAQQKAQEFEPQNRAAFGALQSLGKIPKDLSYATAKTVDPTRNYVAEVDMLKEQVGVEKGWKELATDKTKNLPASVQTKLGGYESGLELVSHVRDEIKNYAQGLGLQNVLPGWAVNRTDPKGVAVRAAIEALTGEIRNQRFGGQLTANEAKYAEQFLPIATDTSDAALIKLAQLETYLEAKRRGLYKQYNVPYQRFTTVDIGTPPSPDAITQEQKAAIRQAIRP